MHSDLWRRVERVYHEALEREPERRAAYIAQACSGDETLRKEVESLLERDPSSPDVLLNRPVFLDGRLAAGTRLGPYEIVGPLGVGGMGEVYKATDSRLGREVAIKVLPADWMADPDRRARFTREAKSASRLNHPHIVTIYDTGEWEGRAYIAMEYVPGKTLDAVIPAGGMPVPQALNAAIPIADALAKAHAAGLIHRDLKPTNIMVTPEGAVKLLDFGLAKWIEREPDAARMASLPETQSLMVVGTPGFMSPEQAEGKPVDARSDIFAFGAVLYQMLTGRRAFPGESAMATVAAVLNRDPEPLPAGLPRDLERIVRRCLRKDPERRWQNMSDVRVALEDLREEALSEVKVEAVASQPTKKPARAWTIAAGATLIAAAVAGGAAWQRWRSPGPEIWSGTLMGGPTIASHPRISPDGNLLLFRALIDGQSQVAVMKPDAASWTVLTHDRDKGAMEFAAWSRDGSKIYSIANTAAFTRSRRWAASRGCCWITGDVRSRYSMDR